MPLRSELINLLQEVVSEQQPDLLSAVDRLTNNLSPRREEKRRLILLLADEVARTGFFETDESVKRGLMLEEIADALGDMQSDEHADKGAGL